MCKKGRGTCLCNGCKACFCRKHFKDHQAKLLDELDKCIGDRDNLQEKINKADHHDGFVSPTLLQIDEWERLTIEKVTQVADQTRLQLTSLLISKRLDIATKFRKVSDELGQLKETEDFVEHDLVRLKEMICEIKQDCEHLAETSSIELHVEQSDQIDWSRLIYVAEKSAHSENNQDQQQTASEFTRKFIYENTRN